MMGYTKIGYFTNISTMQYFNDIRKRKAHNLRRIREERGLKQKEIAEMIGAKESNVSEMERGGRSVSERVIQILSEKLKVDPVQFYFTVAMPFVSDETELKILHRVRETPGMKEQIDKISEALTKDYRGGESFQSDTAVPEKKRPKKRRPA